MTPRTLCALLAFACASSGCFRSTTTIELRPDGSGTIVQETTMKTRTLAAMEELLPSDGSGKPAAGFMTEEVARQTAATMGVTFISGQPFKKADLTGYRARFAFDDISKVRLNFDSNGAPIPEAEVKNPLFVFTFDRRQTSSLLTIQMPQNKPDLLKDLARAEGGGGSADKTRDAQELAIIKEMLKGLFVDISLNVSGRILKTDAPYVQGSRVTLMQVDFDKLLASEAALQQLEEAADLKSLSRAPGVKSFSESKVTIEFSR